MYPVLMSEARTPYYPVTTGDLIGGKYRIESVLGEGGMGVVFEALHVDLHCSVALKVIRPDFQQQPELIARLMLEARAAAQIKSEHVCRVLDVARLETGVPYVVMEYLEGKNLAALLDSRGRLSERTAVDYVLQACEALAEAHRLGIVHRDLKPENLFLAEFPDGRRAIKVLDFGISKLVGGTVVLPSSKGLTNPSSAMGSPHYMAPEQMAAASDVDWRADIWALGAILHQLVTGSFAFDGASLPAVCAAVLQSTPIPVREFVAELSQGLERTILACLVKDRDQRIGNVAELAQRLAPFGSTSATQSAQRISRLMNAVGNPPESEDNPSGTLVSPRQLPTPRTPIPRTSGRPATPQAVTSSKRDLPTQPADGKKSRIPLVLVAVTLLVLSGWGLMSLMRATGPVSRGSAVTLEPSWTTPLAATSAAVAAAPSPNLPPATVAPAPPVASVNAEPAPIASALVVVTHSSVKQAPAARAITAPPRRKASSTQDPYNLDNFGGRR